MKKILMEKKERFRTLTPAVPAQIEKYIEEVPITVYECDFCTRAKLPSADEYPMCIGCGKHACYFCCNDSLKDLWFQIGEDSDTSGDDTSLWTDQSEDFRFASFKICNECLQNPPEKLQKLIKLIKKRNDVLITLNNATGEVIDEIELIK